MNEGARSLAASGRRRPPSNVTTYPALPHVREALRRHRAASDANDFATEPQIYRDDAVLEHPQSGERIRGRQNIQASREAQPNTKRFTVRRMLGSGDIWVSELVLTYDGKPFHTVSIMDVDLDTTNMMKSHRFNEHIFV